MPKSKSVDAVQPNPGALAHVHMHIDNINSEKDQEQLQLRFVYNKGKVEKGRKICLKLCDGNGSDTGDGVDCSSSIDCASSAPNSIKIRKHTSANLTLYTR